MNNRGEQLEAHEVLKAQFLNKLLEQNHNEATRKSFAIIWDSCAQMNKQVQMCFDTKLRREIFNPDIQHIPADYLKSIPETTVMVKSEGDADSLKSILEKSKLTINQTDTQEEKESRFRSITDFPNFLLLVLSVNEKNISLDDKRLLEEFGCIHQSQKELPDPIEFINNLLFYRTCFDRYIIKRETGNDGWNWKILRPNEDPDGDYINSFKDNNRSIIMVHAMLQVSFPGNNYKNWLKQVLLFFKKGQQLNEVDFLPKLENICTEFFNKQEKNLNQGTSTPAYVFNYLDYLLWKLYDKYVRVEGPEIKQNNLIALIKNNKDRFNNFRFTQNNSVEHVAPRNPEGGVEAVNKIDEFGNLCLISRSVNSKLSNRGFPSKKAYYVDIYKANQNRAESLKQVIIFNYHEWKDKEIEERGEEMLAV